MKESVKIILIVLLVIAAVAILTVMGLILGKIPVFWGALVLSIIFGLISSIWKQGKEDPSENEQNQDNAV